MEIIKKSNTYRPAAVGPVIEDYRLSTFSIAEELEEGVLLCQSSTGELVFLTKEEHRAILSGEALSETWALELARRRFLTQLDTDECAAVDKERQAAQAKSSKVLSSFTILPTTCCNAQCFYCYEKGIEQKNMSRETAEDAADFIASSCQGEKVHLGWFGGEPTVAHPIISLICQRLREKNVKFSSGMISNGFLLDEALIKTAREDWLLQHVQITIDGTEPVYNATKNYKSYEGSPFQTVLSHIDSLLASGVRVSVRINLGLHNYDDLYQLIGQLAPRYRGKKGFSAYVHEIDNYYSDQEYASLMERTAELNLLLVQEGIQDMPALPSIRLHSCMADNDDSVIINPEGQLGKCEHYCYEKLHGSIYSEESDEKLKAQWKEVVRFPQCSSCPLYPSCMRLNWCNGGSFLCREGSVQTKLLQTRKLMTLIYEKWKEFRKKFKESSCFVLSCPFELQQSGEELSAVFYDEDREPLLSLPVNQTALDILTLLREKHTFTELVDMLKNKYNTSGYDVEAIAEEYLLSIIETGICKKELI